MTNLLLNQTIKEVKIASDKQALLFIAEDGTEFKAFTDGACCSYTWIEHIEMPALGLPFKIVAIEDLDMPDLGNMEDCNVVSYYGAKITTDKGEMIIDYRNDSNGYYGGNIVWPVSEGEYNYFYGGVHGQNISNEEWQDIVE